MVYLPKIQSICIIKSHRSKLPQSSQILLKSSRKIPIRYKAASKLFPLFSNSVLQSACYSAADSVKFRKFQEFSSLLQADGFYLIVRIRKKKKNDLVNYI